MRPNFEVIQQYTGDGTLADYTFDFKIDDLTKIMVVQVSDTDVEQWRVRGDDTTHLTSVDFDAEEGGGTAHLAAVVPVNYRLILLLADDEPTQLGQFRNKLSFDLKTFEMVLDHIVGGLQRAAWLAQRAIRVNDIQDFTVSPFDPQLPFPVEAGRAIIVNSAGDGIEYGPTADDIANAETFADAAAVSAASAAAAAGAQLSSQQKYDFVASQAATSLAGGAGVADLNGALFTSYTFEYEVIRGGNVISNGRFHAQLNGGNWRVVLADDNGDAHGLTIALLGAGLTTSLTLAVDGSIAGAGKLKLRRFSYAVA